MNDLNDNFDFKQLKVWQKAIVFAKNTINVINLLETDRKHYRLIENLESATTSISNNIAEGKGRNSRKEFRQFLYISKGSLFEVVSILNLFKELEWISSDILNKMKKEAQEIGKMLSGLIKSLNIPNP